LPSKQPDYRHNRTHAGFLANLNVPAESVKRALQNAWNAAGLLQKFPAEKVGELAREKYASPDWCFKL
jgi:hypothetical protein